MSVYVLAITAAIFLGAGSVVQQRAAAQASSADVLSLKLLLRLVRRPLWLGGAGVSTVGNLMSAAALGMGSVALIQPLLVTRLLFALPLAAAWLRRALPTRDWGAALATSAGLAMFVIAGHPHQGRQVAVPTMDWVVAGGVILSLVLTGIWVGRRLSPRGQAPLLAAAAGILYGFQAALMHSLLYAAREVGVVGLLLTWYPYAGLALATLSTVLIQSAFKLAPLPASYPAVVVAEPLAGIVLGFSIQGAVLRLGPVPLGLSLIGIAVMVGGVYLLASSPLVTGQLTRRSTTAPAPAGHAVRRAPRSARHEVTRPAPRRARARAGEERRHPVPRGVAAGREDSGARPGRRHRPGTHLLSGVMPPVEGHATFGYAEGSD